MHKSGLSVPVAYVVFNRPRHTGKSFAAIRAQRPSTLFIVADGPRNTHPDDRERCLDVRRIVEHIDWPCTIHRNYSDVNLGCKRRMSTGLDWVFTQVDRAIIVEDDCVGTPEFFTFCEALLNRYAQDERVWAVAANSYQPEHKWGDGAYYFSKYADCWGWATWRRAWRHYQGDVPFLDEWKCSPRWGQCFPGKAEQRYWARTLQLVRQGMIDTWDYPWTASVLYGGGLIATANANLVQNIGFDSEGTHTTERDSTLAYELIPLGELVHPSHVAADVEADAFYFCKHFAEQSSLWRRVVRQVKKALQTRFWRRPARAAA